MENLSGVFFLIKKMDIFFKNLNRDISEVERDTTLRRLIASAYSSDHQELAKEIDHLGVSIGFCISPNTMDSCQQRSSTDI